MMSEVEEAGLLWTDTANSTAAAAAAATNSTRAFLPKGSDKSQNTKP
jgi:hypothetical protein